MMGNDQDFDNRTAYERGDKIKKFDIDWDHIEKLLLIVNMTVAHGPKLAHITNAAMSELSAHSLQAEKASNQAVKEQAERKAEDARKHVEEVHQAEEERLAKEEEAIKNRPAGKTPAEITAETQASHAAEEAARANTRLDETKRIEEGKPAEPRTLTPGDQQAADRDAQLQRDADSRASAGDVGAVDATITRRI